MAGLAGPTVAVDTVMDALVTAAIGRDMLTVVQVTAIAQAMPIGAVRLAVTPEAGTAATLVAGPAAQAPSMLAADSMAVVEADSTAVEADSTAVVAATEAATGNLNQVIR